jgi:hypothetical protein
MEWPPPRPVHPSREQPTRGDSAMPTPPRFKGVARVEGTEPIPPPTNFDVRRHGDAVVRLIQRP